MGLPCVCDGERVSIDNFVLRLWRMIFRNRSGMEFRIFWEWKIGLIDSLAACMHLSWGLYEAFRLGLVWYSR